MEPANSVKELIDLLHIDKIAEIEAFNDQIREAYESPYVATDPEHFKEIISEYFSYHYMNWLNVGLEMPMELSHARAEDILRQTRPDALLSRAQIYLNSESGGYNIAAKNAIRGRNGGLIKIIDTIAEGIKKEAVKHYITAVFLDCLDPMNFEQRLEFANEYIQEFGTNLFPGEELEHPALLAANIETLVENHVNVINQLRTIIQ